MYRSLLVPLDGSLFAEQALPMALSIARRAGTSLQLVAVARFSSLTSKASVDEWQRAWRDYLERIITQLRSQGIDSTSSVLLEGEDVAQLISAEAKRVGADVIVMATHGRGAIGRLLLGSIPYELMHCSAKPLLLVRPADGLAQWTDDSLPRHILVALDGSTLAERIIEPAIKLGGLLDADYTLMRVVKSPPFGTPELDSISLSSVAAQLVDEIRSVEERVMKEAQDYLDDVAERMRAQGLKTQTCVAVANDPGTAILDEAGKSDIDLIALETHGRGGLSHLIVGSIALKVMHGTHKPILVQSAAPETQGNC